MTVLNILLPVFLVIALGALFTWRRFLNANFLEGLNRLAYTVGLPCLIVSSVSSATFDASASFLTSGIFLGATALTGIFSLLVGGLLGLSRQSLPTFLHVSYRSNLAYLALPLVAYTYGGVDVVSAEVISLMVVVLMPAVLAYSLSGVLLLEFGQSADIKKDFRKLVGSVMLNPLIVASIIGLTFVALEWHLPVFAERTLNAMGQLALPASLITIGGQLVLTPPGREIFGGIAASLIKLVICPLFGYGLAVYFQLGEMEMKVLLLMLTSPTAVASFLLVKNMGGDARLASSTIVISSVLSFFSFGFILLVF